MGPFRIKEYPHLQRVEKYYREEKRLRKLSIVATREGTALGHTLTTFEVEEGWQSAVATCTRCQRIAAIDWTESPYLFGLVYRARCGERITRLVPPIDLGSMTVGEMQ